MNETSEVYFSELSARELLKYSAAIWLI